MRITFSTKFVLCGVVAWVCSCQRTTTDSGPANNSSSGGKSAASGGATGPASSGGIKGGTATGNGGSGSAGGTTTSNGGSGPSSTGGTTTGTGGNGATGGSNAGGTSASGGSMGAGGFTTGSGGSSGSATTAAPCANGVQDPGETGIDCGGTCPACPVVYKINPPNQCQKQYFYTNCKSGDATTQCGGECQPRNACENAPSKDGKVEGFACSRYMLFSPAMLQAAKDDGATLGWDTSAPPFLHAVVGHDTNTGGIDQGMTGSQPCEVPVI